jgi:hypothetical protein
VFGEAQSVGLDPHVKRHVFCQLVRLSVAAELADRRVGPLARLTDQAYEQGHQQLQQPCTTGVPTPSLGQKSH